MPIIAKETSAPRELIPVGNHVARCIGIIQIGTVTENIMGTEKKMQKVRLTWELPYETRVFDQSKGEQPCVFSKEYTLSLSDKANLRNILQSWRGKAFTAQELEGFDITNVVGAPCMLNIIHEPSKKDPTKMYEHLASVAALAKGTVCPPQVNGSRVLSYDNFDWDTFNALPDFIKDKMKGSDEYKEFVAKQNGRESDITTQSSSSKNLPEAEVIGEDESDLPF